MEAGSSSSPRSEGEGGGGVTPITQMVQKVKYDLPILVFLMFVYGPRDSRFESLHPRRRRAEEDKFTKGSFFLMPKMSSTKIISFSNLV